MNYYTQTSEKKNYFFNAYIFQLQYVLNNWNFGEIELWQSGIISSIKPSNKFLLF